MDEIRDARGNPIELNPALLRRTREATFLSYKDSTRATYGTGVANYVEFMIEHEVDRASWLPMSLPIARAWIAARVGAIGRSAMSNAIAGVHAWEAINGFHSMIPQGALEALLRSAEVNGPQRRPLRAPIQLSLIERVHPCINPADPFNIAFYACLTTTFHCTARLGEFTVPTEGGFNPRYHVTPAQIERRVTAGGFGLTVFRLPWTKTAVHGQEVYWAPQRGPGDPERALAKHLACNAPPRDRALFSFIQNGAYTPMTKPRFLARLQDLCRELHEPRPHGHGLRIGNTLELLLSGLSLMQVQVKGRWKSDTSFQKYLREHAEVLAPHIQAEALEEGARRFLLPPR
jgi:hypothetical protein